MTGSRDQNHLLRTYLQDGPAELPDRSFDAVRVAIDTTKQRAVIGPWRTPVLPSLARLAVVVVVVLSSLAGVYLAPRLSGVGGVAAPPSSGDTPVESPAPPPVSNGWIAYSTDRPAPGSTDATTGSDLYLVREGGTPTLIAGRDEGATRNACPSFSPDGTMLAYGAASRGSESVVVVRGVDDAGVTGEDIRITVPGVGRPPPCVRWSRDGTRIAYLVGGFVVVRGLDGSTLAPAAGDPTAADRWEPPDSFAGVPSPSYERSARIQVDADVCELVLSRPVADRETVDPRAGAARADDTGLHVVPLGFCPYAIAAWSPDGTRILLMHDVSGTHFTMHAVSVDSGLESVIVSRVRTNGARSWPHLGDVSWQPVLP